MKALVLGAGGQVGRALMASVPSHMAAVGLDRASLDVCNAQAVSSALDIHRPDVVINAAAYTAVDRAESEPETAQAINGDAVGSLGRACHERSIRLVHISTDFVFDGRSSRPYKPTDPVNPLSAYGQSKRAGEEALLALAGANWLVLRTAWVYAAEGRNFLRTMLKLFGERDMVNVVADQVGTPTSAASLANGLWRAARSDMRGIHHYTDAGVASWYDFAQAILEEATAAGLVGRRVSVRPITTEEYPTPARRPSYSVLDMRSAMEALGIEQAHWRVRLRATLKELGRA